MKRLEIIIGKGLSDVKFGISKQDLIQLVGKPNDKELYDASDEDDGYLTETWHYDEDEFSVSFDEEDDWKLTTISTSNNNVELFDEKLIGLPLNEVTQFLSSKKIGNNTLDDFSNENQNENVLNYIEASLSLWFIDDKLSEIQWGVLWKDEDTPLWP